MKGVEMGTGNGHDPKPIAPTLDAPMDGVPDPGVVGHRVSWWGELGRFSKAAVMLTAIMVFWSTIGDNVTSCADRYANDKQKDEKIESLIKSDSALQLEQVSIKQKIANFESNFAIQTAEIGEARQDISEVKADVKQIQRDMQQLLVIMAERKNP